MRIIRHDALPDVVDEWGFAVINHFEIESPWGASPTTPTGSPAEAIRIVTDAEVQVYPAPPPLGRQRFVRVQCLSLRPRWNHRDGWFLDKYPWDDVWPETAFGDPLVLWEPKDLIQLVGMLLGLGADVITPETEATVFRPVSDELGERGGTGVAAFLTRFADILESA